MLTAALLLHAAAAQPESNDAWLNQHKIKRGSWQSSTHDAKFGSEFRNFKNYDWPHSPAFERLLVEQSAQQPAAHAAQPEKHVRLRSHGARHLESLRLELRDLGDEVAAGVCGAIDLDHEESDLCRGPAIVSFLSRSSPRDPVSTRRRARPSG